MEQIRRTFPAPFGDDRKTIMAIYPDEDNDRSALIYVDEVFQGSTSYDKRKEQFVFGKSRESKLSETDEQALGDLFFTHHMHDKTRWLRISQPLFTKTLEEQIPELLAALKKKAVAFSDVVKFIEQHYNYTPTAFKNGEVYNGTATNQGSAKVLAFAKLNCLSIEDTLLLFAEHYDFVLAYPKAKEHQNIREFIAQGWNGVIFEGEVLSRK
jgi:hypothetical protein